MNLNEFYQTKLETVQQTGFHISKEDIEKRYPFLFPFQVAILQWALKLGRAACLAGCGLGKSPIQLAWAELVKEHTRKPVLILAPLAVAGQTVKEAEKFGCELIYHRTMMEWDGETNIITNYEMLKNWNLDVFGGCAWDESSIIRNFDGKTKKLIFQKCADTRYLLALTATPAPNDARELGNHAEGLRIMKSTIMDRTWFSHNSGNVHESTLKAHAADDFWRWVTQWAVCLDKPSDLGDFDDAGYILPPLNFIGHIVPVDHRRAWKESQKSGQLSLLLTGRTSATNMHAEKRQTYKERMELAADLVKQIRQKKPEEHIIVWCEYNYEADLLVKLIPEAIEVRGNEKMEVKRQKLLDFTFGKYPILITKPKIAAHGLNWQHVGEQIWTSISHKFEQFYQGYKRSHRFGRIGPVNCHIIYAESEGDILTNLKKKQVKHEYMQGEMVRLMRENGMSLSSNFHQDEFVIGGAIAEGDGWKVYHGDSAVELQKVKSNSVDFWVQSPPFKEIFVYSDAVQDLGNSHDDNQFFTQYGFILREQLRASKPGTYKVEHCQDLPLLKRMTGHEMGLVDFPGELIKLHEDNGWEYVGCKTIWKDPVIEMQRKKVLGLLWSKSFVQKAEYARQGVADHMLVFRKPDHKTKEIKLIVNKLPQSVIDRCVDLWSNPDENIQSPNHKPALDQKIDLMIVDCTNNTGIVTEQMKNIQYYLRDGRTLVCHVTDLPECTQIINAGKRHDLIFHSRVALNDNSFLIVLRKWVKDMSDKNPDIIHVTHDLIPPGMLVGYTEKEVSKDKFEEMPVYTIDENVSNETHKYIGNSPPDFWDTNEYYSIQVWQRYASPVWFDLDGLPKTNSDIWMNINQTDVLEYRVARDSKDEKHLAPLQLPVIEKCIKEYTNPSDMVGTGFAGVFSEIYQAIIMGRRAVGCELKRSYWELGKKHMRHADVLLHSPTLFDFGQSQNGHVENLFLTPVDKYLDDKNLHYFGGIVTANKDIINIPYLIESGKSWIMDNGAFTKDGFIYDHWLLWLEEMKPYQDQCIAVVIPDIVGDCKATLEQFPQFAPIAKKHGYKVAFVTQDGLTPEMTPWDDFDCLFVGGSDWHKMGKEAGLIIEEGLKQNKHIHIGRVNTSYRLTKFWQAHTWDGTSLARGHKAAMKYQEEIVKGIKEVIQMKSQRQLF